MHINLEQGKILMELDRDSRPSDRKEEWLVKLGSVMERFTREWGGGGCSGSLSNAKCTG